MVQSLAAWREHLAKHRGLIFCGLLVLTLVLALTVGFFLRGGTHGLYSDDYSEKAWARDFSTGRWRLNLNPIHPSFRPLHSILTPNITNAIPEFEFPVRVGIMVVHLANVLLLALLVNRLTGSGFMAVIAGAYFLMPIFSNEALLWFTNAVPITISLFLLLVGFHIILSCDSIGSDLALLISGVIAWVLMGLFYESGLFTLLLLPVFIAMMRSRGERASRMVWILALIAAYIPLGIYLFFVQSNSWQIGLRGGPTFDLVFILSHRVPEVFGRLVWLLTDWGGSGPLREALELGLREWLSVPAGWMILVGLLVGVVLVPIAYPVNREEMPSWRQALTLALAGLAWMGLGLAPILLLKTQIVEIRTLYVPWAGLSLSVAGFFGWTIALLSRFRRAGIQAALLMAGAVVFANSLSMAGLVRTYQLRWELDQKQLSAFRAAIPNLPMSNPLWLLPVALDERTVSLYFGREAQLDRYLFGVFELPWSSRDAIRLEYGERDIRTVAADRWETLHVTSVQRSESGHVITVTIKGRTIPIDHLLAFTYRQGHVIVLSPLVFSSPDTRSSIVVDLPLVARVRSDGLDVQPVRFNLEHP